MQSTDASSHQYSTFTIATNNGLILQGARYKPVKSIGSLIVVHGVGEHLNRYQSFIQQITAANFTCYIYDQRGHGSSDGKRGHIAKFENYVNDLNKVFDLVFSESHGKPIFVYGHSMGSIVATLFTLYHQDKIKGLILSGFPFRPSIPISGLTLKIIKFLGKTFPLLSIPTMINVKHLSHDKAVWDAYDQDPMTNKTVTLGWITEFYSVLDILSKNLCQLKLSLLMMHGGDDKVARLNGAEQAFQSIKSKDKTFRIFNEQRHELLNELPPTPEQVISLMINWMTQRLKAS